MKSADAFQNFINPSGRALTCTLEGTGAATCVLLPNGNLVFDLAAAQHTKYVAVTLPYRCRVVGAKLIHGNATTSTCIVETATPAVISDTMSVASDKAVTYASTIDDAYSEFTEGAVMHLLIGTAAMTGIAIVELQPL
jgi:hypothetical protein